MLMIGKWAAVAALGLGAARVVGGWAVVSVENPPEVLRAGATYRLEFTVRQHGVTLLEGLSPHVRVADAAARAASGGGHRIAAEPTGSKGRYAATFTVPQGERVLLTVESGFGRGRRTELTLLPIRVVRAGESLAAAVPAERGRQLFVAKGCASCHLNGDIEEFGQANESHAFGPELTGRALEAAYVRQRITNPASLPPIGEGTLRMPRLDLAAADVDALVAFLSRPQERAAQ
ncbi:MAG: cytochrome c [Gemmatimonadales bacterium]|nr:cytochrome c [Gemmatimonadota bacterium]MBK7783584.1 cytochrome c [Gemmatimonadota bacterium]MBK9068369.1 cytochrome c [Gemmatimonadota bacterium]MBP6667990.1 cytochrome c [Gemmatimonadales bacterium]MBP9198714.1 cytochrome c [Gemmatimonadales bacterium]